MRRRIAPPAVWGPVVRHRVLTYLTLLAALLPPAACGPLPTPTPTPTPVNLAEVVELDLGRDGYLPGELVTITVRAANPGVRPLTIAQLPPEVRVYRLGDPFPVWVSPPGLASETLEPGATVQRQVVWDQRSLQGGPVLRGRYAVSARIVAEGREPVTITAPRPLVLLPAGGTREGVVPLARTTTAGGVAITLERLEMAHTRARVVARLAAEHLPEGTSNVAAVYRVDGGPPLAAQGPQVERRGDEVVLTWELDPVPVAAAQLIFTVQGLPGVAASWHWVVDLG